MTEELGRELTAIESIAVATGQTTILDIVHGAALELNAQRDAEVYTVMPSGTVITKGELWREMMAVRTPRPVAAGQALPRVIGLNASANMFA